MTWGIGDQLIFWGGGAGGVWQEAGGGRNGSDHSPHPEPLIHVEGGPGLCRPRTRPGADICIEICIEMPLLPPHCQQEQKNVNKYFNDAL